MQGTCKWRIEEKVSNKTGNKYKVLIITFANGLEKYIFDVSPELLFILENMK